MNVTLAADGYPWTVIPVERRSDYMESLEAASVDQDIQPFTEFLGGAGNRQHRGEAGTDSADGVTRVLVDVPLFCGYSVPSALRLGFDTQKLARPARLIPRYAHHPSEALSASIGSQAYLGWIGEWLSDRGVARRCGAAFVDRDQGYQ